VLFEAGARRPSIEEIRSKRKIGLIRTTSWEPALGLATEVPKTNGYNESTAKHTLMPSVPTHTSPQLSNLLRSVIQHQVPHARQHTATSEDVEIWDIDLGASSEDVARGLFSALRELDKKGVDVIYVEGIDDRIDDDIAAAVMNRLRKAAEIRL
jgi:L-threonylcarbamoyladenylate synthase